jgi:hypothetical protein
MLRCRSSSDCGTEKIISPKKQEFKMKYIQVYDPAQCCSTGVCGVDVDQELVQFAADVDWAKQNGIRIFRFNLAQQPMAFADNATVRAFLERSGQEALPLVLVDGEVAMAGRYPSRADLGRWSGVPQPVAQPVSTPKAGGCCTPKSGCC